MGSSTKRSKVIQEKVVLGKVYPVLEAIELLKSLSTVKFVEGCDVVIRLGLDARRSNQTVRGSSVLPNGTGRTQRVAVFAQAAKAEEAKAAGADIVGYDDLVATVKSGTIDFDVVIATPDAMRVVGQLGQILGPRGLMPNPKDGTVTMDVGTAVNNAKGGQVRYRTDKNSIVHCTIGKIDFKPEQLRQNLEALLVDLKRLRPTTAKGIYLKKISLSTTMGPGLSIDLASLEN